jgi:hypothetical protein
VEGGRGRVVVDDRRRRRPVSGASLSSRGFITTYVLRGGVTGVAIRSFVYNFISWCIIPGRFCSYAMNTEDFTV